MNFLKRFWPWKQFAILEARIAEIEQKLSVEAEEAVRTLTKQLAECQTSLSDERKLRGDIQTALTAEQKLVADTRNTLIEEQNLHGETRDNLKFAKECHSQELSQHAETKAQLSEHKATIEKNMVHMKKMASALAIRAGISVSFLLLSCLACFGQVGQRNLFTTNPPPLLSSIAGPIVSINGAKAPILSYNAQALTNLNLALATNNDLFVSNLLWQMINSITNSQSWTNSPTAVQEVNPTLPVLFGNAINGGTIFPTGTNTLFQGVQTNAYGGLYTNLFQLQAIDMRGTRLAIGIGADNAALTNNQAAADDSIYLGFGAGFSELGTFQQFNTVIGAYALGNATNGSGAVAIGQKSVGQATNENSTCAIGSKSLASCLSPARDTPIGYAAMQFALGGDTNGPNTGGNRTAIGYISGQYDDGQNNTWIGAGSGPQSHAAPANITGIGLNVCQSVNSSANGGTVIGANSGGALQQFIGTLIGNGTLNAATGNLGTMVGDGSGAGLSFWNRGTGIGSSQAIGWSGSPLGVILIGYGAGTGSVNQQNNVCIFAEDDGNAKITDVFFNNRVSASASSFPITLNAVGGNGSNIGGAAMNIAGGISTGNANGGDVNLTVSLSGTSGSTANALTNEVNVSGATGITTINAGLSSKKNNQAPPLTITVGSSPFSYTNTTGFNDQVFLDANGATTAVSYNGTSIFTSLVAGDHTIMLQNNEWVTVTYSVATPVMKHHAF